ncbi:peptide/nickel transport system substrate-binding protein [Evansella vedderi]|uniref:Peptide/nickel transport system substrate-binding protein n=1 Tax=Evansella vedderi TaxID=38282 RepID=A0ABU0A2U0_9BACI|nr:peptide-binding protein [Evansella vedderi]MDQ0257811.1 peptide/nickel transport system substrate-binding protein [Evansella vedderi]
MKAKKLLALLMMVLLLSIFAVACGGGEEDPAEQDDPAPATEDEDGTEDEGDDTAAGEPQYGGSIVLGGMSDPVMFNPYFSQDSASADVEGLLFGGLMASNPELEMVPHHAKDYPEVSEDGLVWTYELHEGILFHDGEELTAHDVVFSFSIPIHEDYTGPRASTFQYLESVEALDDYTVQFTLSQPDAAWPITASYAILPEHILGDVPVADLEDYNEFNLENPIGSGPFKFVDWNTGTSLTLEAHEDYFEGRPYLDRVTWRFAADQNALVLLLETGDVDFITVPANELATVETFDHVNISSTLALNYSYIGWNLQNPLFQDVRVRQALTHAIDRQEIVETILEGEAEVAHAPASPLSWAYPPEVPEFHYDPDRALELLAEAGWEPNDDGILEKDGETFSFTVLSNDGNTTRRDIGIIMQQMLGDIGIEVTPEQMEWGAFLDRINPPNYDFDAIILGWNLGLDPNPEAIWASWEIEQGLNNISYSNERVDEIARENSSIVDQDERAELLHEAFQIIAEEQPYTFLFYPNQHLGMTNTIDGFTHHPRVTFYRVNDWWINE